MSDQAPQPQPQNGFMQQLWPFVIILIVLLLFLGVGMWAVRSFDLKPSDNAVLGFLAITAIILAFAGAILWKIINGDIALYGIIAEPPVRDADGNLKLDPVTNQPIYTGKASLARFQFLLFTFVVAGLFLMLSIEVGQFVNIPANVLGLIGISGGSFVLSKAIGDGNAANNNANLGGPNNNQPVANPAPPAAPPASDP